MKEPQAFEMLIMKEAAGQAHECYIWDTACISRGQHVETQHLGTAYRRFYFQLPASGREDGSGVCHGHTAVDSHK